MTVFRIVMGPLRSAEVGYWVDQKLAGRGLAPTALALAADHCFGVMGLHRLEANIQPDNLASRRMVEKPGFRAGGPVSGRCTSTGPGATPRPLGVVKLSFVFQRQFIRGILSGAVKG